MAAEPPQNYREQVRSVVNHITRNYIAEVPRDVYDPERGIADLLDAPTDRDHFMPITTTLAVLNCCLGGNTLIEGGKGTGKTKLATVVGTLLFQLPYEFLEAHRVVGTQGATVSEIYATIDPAELMKGKNVGILYLPFHAPFIVIDELNRFSELEQNRIREGIATGVWKYASHAFVVPDQVVVSAMNPEEYGGTSLLNENLIDNYALTLEPAHANPLAHGRLVREAEGRMKKELGAADLHAKVLAYATEHPADSKGIQMMIKEMQEETRKRLDGKKIPMIYNGFIPGIQEAVGAVPFSAEANLFLLATLAEMTYSKKFGINRIEDPASDSTHDTAYLGAQLREAVAGRFMKDWHTTSKAIAWYLGKTAVDVDDVKAAFYYTAPRRIAAEEEFFQQALQGTRSVPYRVKLTKEAMESVWKNYSDFKGKDTENPAFGSVRKAIRILNGAEQGGEDEAIRLLKGADHPLARACLEALAIHKFSR